MSISQSLSNALSGLNTLSRMATVTSSNLANALTEGYGVRRADLSAQVMGRDGAGVRIDGITRVVDRGILAERRLADAALGGRAATAQTLALLETAIGAPDDGDGLSGRIVALEASLTRAAADPSSDLRLEDATARLSDVAGALRDRTRAIGSMRQEADADIGRQVGALNSALDRVETLNGDILRARATGADAAALMDQRQRAIDEISAIVPVRELQREDGRVALMTTAGEVLIDGPAARFDFQTTPLILPHMTLVSGDLSGISRDGTAYADGIGRLGGGALAAAFERRDEILVAAQGGLDAVARDLVERFQDPGNDPTLSPGDPGLLTDAGGTFVGPDATGLAGRLRLNAALDPASGGAPARLRDGLGAAGIGPVGNGAQLQRWIDGVAEPRALAGAGGTQAGAARHAADLSTRIGADRVVAEEGAAFAAARWTALRETELAGGVDSDAEMQMLLRIEQSYAANARVIETVQAMMRTLMEL